MIIESIVAYLAIIAPSAITIITALAALITAIAKFATVVKQNKGLKDEMLALVKQQDTKIAAVLDENIQLKEALTNCTDALTRIRNKHPEVFKKEE